MHRLAPSLILIPWLIGCGRMPSDPAAALEAVGGKVTRDAALPNEPIVEVRLTNPYATCPPFLVFEYVSDRHLQPLRELADLKRLTIKSDKLTDAGLAHLAGLRKLEHLDLEVNNITDVGLAHLRDLTNLRELRIVGSWRIGDDGLAHLAGLTQLESLELVCAHTTTPDGLAVLAQLPNLTHLRIKGLGFDDAYTAQLASLQALEHLDVDFRRLTGQGLAHLRNLTALKELDLRTAPWAVGGEDNTISDSDLQHLTQLTALETLHLPRGITDAGLARLRSLKKLKQLGLWHTSVTDKGLRHLTALTQLETVLLPRATVTDEGAQRLRELFPSAKIEFRQAQFATTRWLDAPPAGAGL